MMGTAAKKAKPEEEWKAAQASADPAATATAATAEGEGEAEEGDVQEEGNQENKGDATNEHEKEDAGKGEGEGEQEDAEELPRNSIVQEAEIAFTEPRAVASPRVIAPMGQKSDDEEDEEEGGEDEDEEDRPGEDQPLVSESSRKRNVQLPAEHTDARRAAPRWLPDRKASSSFVELERPGLQRAQSSRVMSVETRQSHLLAAVICLFAHAFFPLIWVALRLYAYCSSQRQQKRREQDEVSSRLRRGRRGSGFGASAGPETQGPGEIVLFLRQYFPSYWTTLPSTMDQEISELQGAYRTWRWASIWENFCCCCCCRWCGCIPHDGLLAAPQQPTQIKHDPSSDVLNTSSGDRGSTDPADGLPADAEDDDDDALSERRKAAAATAAAARAKKQHEAALRTPLPGEAPNGTLTALRKAYVALTQLQGCITPSVVPSADSTDKLEIVLLYWIDAATRALSANEITGADNGHQTTADSNSKNDNKTQKDGKAAASSVEGKQADPGQEQPQSREERAIAHRDELWHLIKDQSEDLLKTLQDPRWQRAASRHAVPDRLKETNAWVMFGIWCLVTVLVSVYEGHVDNNKEHSEAMQMIVWVCFSAFCTLIVTQVVSVAYVDPAHDEMRAARPLFAPFGFFILESAWCLDWMVLHQEASSAKTSLAAREAHILEAETTNNTEKSWLSWCTSCFSNTAQRLINPIRSWLPLAWPITAPTDTSSHGIVPHHTSDQDPNVKAVPPLGFQAVVPLFVMAVAVARTTSLVLYVLWEYFVATPWTYGPHCCPMPSIACRLRTRRAMERLPLYLSAYRRWLSFSVQRRQPLQERLRMLRLSQFGVTSVYENVLPTPSVPVSVTTSMRAFTKYRKAALPSGELVLVPATSPICKCASYVQTAEREEDIRDLRTQQRQELEHGVSHSVSFDDSVAFEVIEMPDAGKVLPPALHDAHLQWISDSGEYVCEFDAAPGQSEVHEVIPPFETFTVKSNRESEVYLLEAVRFACDSVRFAQLGLEMVQRVARDDVLASDARNRGRQQQARAMRHSMHVNADAAELLFENATNAALQSVEFWVHAKQVLGLFQVRSIVDAPLASEPEDTPRITSMAGQAPADGVDEVDPSVPMSDEKMHDNEILNTIANLNAMWGLFAERSPDGADAAGERTSLTHDRSSSIEQHNPAQVSTKAYSALSLIVSREDNGEQKGILFHFLTQFIEPLQAVLAECKDDPDVASAARRSGKLLLARYSLADVFEALSVVNKLAWTADETLRKTQEKSSAMAWRRGRDQPQPSRSDPEFVLLETVDPAELMKRPAAPPLPGTLQAVRPEDTMFLQLHPYRNPAWRASDLAADTGTHVDITAALPSSAAALCKNHFTSLGMQGTSTRAWRDFAERMYQAEKGARATDHLSDDEGGEEEVEEESDQDTKVEDKSDQEEEENEDAGALESKEHDATGSEGALVDEDERMFSLMQEEQYLANAHFAHVATSRFIWERSHGERRYRTYVRVVAYISGLFSLHLAFISTDDRDYDHAGGAEVMIRLFGCCMLLVLVSTFLGLLHLTLLDVMKRLGMEKLLGAVFESHAGFDAGMPVVNDGHADIQLFCGAWLKMRGDLYSVWNAGPEGRRGSGVLFTAVGATLMTAVYLLYYLFTGRREVLVVVETAVVVFVLSAYTLVMLLKAGQANDYQRDHSAALRELRESLWNKYPVQPSEEPTNNKEREAKQLRETLKLERDEQVDRQLTAAVERISNDEENLIRIMRAPVTSSMAPRLAVALLGYSLAFFLQLGRF